jgi:hypothetical protein
MWKRVGDRVGKAFHRLGDRVGNAEFGKELHEEFEFVTF